MFKSAFCYLYDKPHVGVFSGFGSLPLAFIEFLTNEHSLKIVAGIGAWAGATVAILSIPAALFKNYNEFKNFRNNKNQPK